MSAELNPTQASARHRWLAMLVAGFRIGTRYTQNPTLQRKVMQINLGAVVLAVTVLVYNLAFIWAGGQALIFTGLIQIPLVLLLVSVVIWSHLRGHLVLARWTLFIGVMVDVLLTMAAGQGTYTFIHSYFVMFALLSPAFFPLTQWRSALGYALANIAIFSYLQSVGWEPDPELYSLPLDMLYWLKTCMASSCVLTAVVVMLMSEHSAARKEAELQLLANTDYLTALPNRRAFEEVLQRELARSRRDGSPISVAIVDVDFFKRVNDVYGHDVGDHVLRTLGKLLLTQSRTTDMVARLGGEEFVVLMPQTPIDRALIVTQRMRLKASHHVFGENGLSLHLTISVGLAHVDPAMSVEETIKAADTALYVAKSEGRNRVAVSSGDPSSATARNPDLEANGGPKRV